MTDQDSMHLRAAAWIYRGVWALVVRVFKVPERPPTLPALLAQNLRTFRPSEGFLRYLKIQFWIWLVVSDAILIGLWIALIVYWPLVGVLVTPLALAIIVLPDILLYIAIHLRYDTTWYVLSDRSLRIRRGIWRIHETTLTYNNIQNVKVTQGPLERYFGIANVIVHTAGGGGGDPHGGNTSQPHLGRIEGVDNAEELRTLVMDRSEAASDSGLGDVPDHELQPQAAWNPAHIRVLQEIAAAARMLA